MDLTNDSPQFSMVSNEYWEDRLHIPRPIDVQGILSDRGFGCEAIAERSRREEWSYLDLIAHMQMCAALCKEFER